MLFHIDEGKTCLNSPLESETAVFFVLSSHFLALQLFNLWVLSPLSRSSHFTVGNYPGAIRPFLQKLLQSAGSKKGNFIKMRLEIFSDHLKG